MENTSYNSSGGTNGLGIIRILFRIILVAVSLSLLYLLVQIVLPSCLTCGGDGIIDEKIDCASCNGSGHITVNCTACGGTGYVAIDSPCPKCHGGGCTNAPCYACGRTGKCPACKGTGERNWWVISALTTCPTCDGKKYCSKCGGDGEIQFYCSVCNGKGSRKTTLPCKSCSGKGQVKKDCSTCKGKGKYEVSKPCPECGKREQLKTEE